ncbi:hypothetical protein BKA69DRAFT_1127277 [Paraphysoderma sedebokerense]|nr:hypothetical protein BKA69DRAFT_1127277 [Paraphysoderma sedebokerense]
MAERWDVGTIVTLLQYLHLRLYQTKCEQLLPNLPKNTREWWRVVAIEVPHLAKLALHLSAFTPHSAAVKRALSSLDHIRNCWRNKVEDQKVMKMTKIKTTLMREQKAERQKEQALSGRRATLNDENVRAEEGGSMGLNDNDLQPISTVQEWEAELQDWLGVLDEDEAEDPQYLDNIVLDDAFMKETVTKKWKLEDLFDFNTLPPIVTE